MADEYAVVICPAIAFAHRGGRVMEPTTGPLSEAALERRVEKLEAGAR